MNFLTSLQADRLIAQIREEGDPSSGSGKKLFAKLGKLGTGAIPKILEALASADKRQTVEYVELLSSLVSEKTLPLVTRGLADGDPRTVSGTASALSSNKKFNVNRLVDLLGEDEYSKAAIVEVLQAHKDRLNVRQLLAQIYFLQPSEKAAVFKLIDEVANEDMVPDLLARIDGKDPLVKTHLINVLARFDRPDVNKALQDSLRDTHKLVRGAALACDEGGGLLEAVLVTVRAVHGRARLGEEQRGGAADAARGAGDERGAAGEVVRREGHVRTVRLDLTDRQLVGPCWQAGHQYVIRSPSSAFRIRAPQRRQGWPSRP